MDEVKDRAIWMVTSGRQFGRTVKHLKALIAHLGYEGRIEVSAPDYEKLRAENEQIRKLCEAQQDYIDKTPCDPDVYRDQWQSWLVLQKIKGEA